MESTCRPKALPHTGCGEQTIRGTATKESCPSRAALIKTQTNMVTLSAIFAIVFLVFRGSAIEYAHRHKLIARELKTQATQHKLGRVTTLIRKHWGIALDKENLVLLYVRMEQRELKTQLINLNYMHSCRIVRKHNVLQSRMPFQKLPKEYLEQILLEIQLSLPEGRYYIPFFDDDHDQLSEMKTLFQKAWHWQCTILRQCNR
jgi:hypothetical protein